MQKIINITLGGRSITIAETAFEKVQNYIASLRAYFNNEEGRDEIVADIEARFAELMHDKIRKGAAHITDADVEEMIQTMGRPEDFAAQDEGAAGYAPNFTMGEKRRLYRDQSNKILGGVCSGIANWLNIDPTIVRVLFAIVSFGGFGAGIFIYLVLWIFLPTRNMKVYSGKRMFRDPDNKWFGGVAGGMGAYFNINPNIIRWILAIPLLLSVLRGVNVFRWNDGFDIFPNLLFNGLTGTFIFIYIVLWIVLPEALTPYQKMEMHGKNVDINAIKQNVQSTIDNIGERMQTWSKEVQDSAEKFGQKANEFAQKKGPQFGHEFSRAAQRSGEGIGYAIAMIFKVFFIIIGGIIAVSLLAIFLTFLFSGFVWAPVNNFLWTSDTQQMLGWGTLLLFFGAPIVGMVVWLVRKVLNVDTPGNYLNWTFGGLWALGWVCLMFFLASISSDFKRYETAKVSVDLRQPAGDKLVFQVSAPELKYEGSFGWATGNIDIEGIQLTEDSLKLATITLDFQKSNDSLYHIVVEKTAIGKTDAEALQRADKIHYTLSQQDSIIDLPSHFVIDKNTKYRFQHIVINVMVPVDKKINIRESVFAKLINADFEFNDKRGSGGNPRFVINNIKKYRSNTDYIMRSDGSLQSADINSDIVEPAPGNNGANNDYRWGGTEPNNDTIRNASPGATPPDTTTGENTPYRYNPTHSQDKEKETLLKELEQKQKELEELKKKLENQ